LCPFDVDIAVPSVLGSWRVVAAETRRAKTRATRPGFRRRTAPLLVGLADRVEVVYSEVEVAFLEIVELTVAVSFMVLLGMPLILAGVFPMLLDVSLITEGVEVALEVTRMII